MFFNEIMTQKELKLMVFDLDYTLWPFYIDVHFIPPFKTNSTGQIVDSSESPINCYPEVPEILSELKKEGYLLAIASRTTQIEGAKQLIRLFGWDQFFQCIEIFPGRKTDHLFNIRTQSGVEYDEMVFFDDEFRNLNDIKILGVTTVFVSQGINKATIKEAKMIFKVE